MESSLDTRMKNNYEHRTRYYLPRRTYTIIRIDGKAFHTWTAAVGCAEPFDETLTDLMDRTALFLCAGIQGARLGYVQSDEISILLTDFETEATEAWFNGNIQKIASVSASMATGFFNQEKKPGTPTAYFDSRVFTIPDPIEVENYFISRQKDATRNSVQMVAQSLYSHKELHGKSNTQMQEMIFSKGQNWNDYKAGLRRGRVIIYVGTKWVITDPPVFTAERDFLRSRIPVLGFGDLVKQPPNLG